MPNPSHSIKEALESLGYNLIDNGDHWRTSAIYRGGSNQSAIAIYKDSGVWTDFGAGCESMPIDSLIGLSLGTEDPEKIKEVYSGSSNSQKKEVDYSEKINTKAKVFDKSTLSKLLPHYKFFIDRRISENDLRLVGGGLAMEGKMYQRYVFPVFDEYDRIVGFSGRNASPSSDRPKWKHIGEKSSWVYPAFLKDSKGNEFVLEAILESNEVILVESIGDVLAFWANGIYNVICIFGLSTSSRIISFLVSNGVNSVVISLNKELENGLLGSVKTYIKLLDFFDYDQIKICLPKSNDFGDMQRDGVSFSEWVDKKNSINPEEQKLHILSYAEKYNKHKVNKRASLSDAAFKKIKKELS